ncbi:hypothetical protein PILCRDRAFT_820270 [Piloderma croceum F 1598]|uniref:F-box domain-containing protein n=1 Tax=Piloderma croceum (strain F 1598) TaxID=765440 RepID=A0A0C3FCN1_PILCF|nr:hypothetical protein PILCRDRAFT_820270 [Piloderma croceum F 1598]
MSEHMSTFAFPSDIERLIFECASRDDTQTALRLALVSRRAQCWVESIIYRFVNLYPARTKNAFIQSLEVTTKPSSFYNRCIKILFLPFCRTFKREWGDDIETAVKLLPYCQGAEYVFLWISPDYVDMRLKDLLINMRPKRLDADLMNLLGATQPDFSLPFFDNVTHLVISQAPKNCIAIRALPHLSHFLIDWIDKNVMPDDCNLLKVAADLLSHSETLKVCAIRYVDANVDTVLPELQDGRLVFIIAVIDWFPHWLSFARGELDIWAYAEAAVTKQTQQGGRIEPIRC